MVELSVGVLPCPYIGKIGIGVAILFGDLFLLGVKHRTDVKSVGYKKERFAGVKRVAQRLKCVAEFTFRIFADVILPRRA